ncbi:sickle tail protein isoform X2 [Coregonus clupeaformis]|uniref:sickle tail protein isoform X2 n=1 Tax=Coregonus clupeaformis TaxID=59861 RepID=UPI001E1C4606|nr:sickle tail protein isoform X2 [Coregonus clupeaformis]
MSKASRLARPSSVGAGSKLPFSRKEAPGGSRARVVSVGEKLMRAGSDGTLTKQRALSGAAAAPPAQQQTDKQQSQMQSQTQSQSHLSQAQTGNMVTQPKSRISPPKASALPQGSMHKQTKSNLKVTSPEDSEQLSSRQGPPNGTPTRAQDPKGNGSRTVPRRHTLGGARSSQEILAMQPSDMDKKREAFLEHLKQKYPHHASAIMGHQERLREQSLQGMLSSLHSELDIQRYLLKIQLPHTSRSPAHGPSSSIVGEQPEHLSLASLESLETMSEADAHTAFTRGSRSRASLPVVRSTNQTRDRSLGVLYLQYGDETKQIRMPNEITSGDTIRALFVSAFPQQLTMKMLESPSVAVYVKDDMRNMYYELTDVRNITDHSCLKVYHKDPAQAFSHGPRPTNVDTRMHREMMYASRDGQHPPRHPPMGHPPHHPMQGSLSPTTAHSMPPSPSRIPFGPRPGSMPCSATMPRERISNATPPVRSVSPCPSAILERRDVKPDEDLGSKSHSLVRGGEGLYADPYLLHEGRMGHGPAHGGHPPPGDMVDHGSLAGYHRASIRSTGSYSGPSPTEAMEQTSLYRQKSRKYGDSQLPTLGSKTPPPSPHRMAEVRMIDIHGAPPPHGGIPLERSSPVRQSFRKEEVVKSRSNMASPVVPDLQGHGPIPPANDPQTRERMKAMEQQIASLTGLVQHALLKSPNTSGTNEALSEQPMKTSRQASPVHSAHSAGGSPVLAPKTPAPPSESGSTLILPGSAPFQANLLQCKKNVSDLRLQLHQMRQLQLQNQEALHVQLKRAEQEISLKLAEAMRRLEDPVQRQRVLVEEDRHKYLGLEERVFNQLGELELYVGTLKRETGSAGAHRAVTLKHVEEGAVSLRRVGESLAGLKGEFPALQTRMRAVLRVEVEAVKFLKEEPHKLDSMLKRVKSLTETLSSLKRCATEGLLKGSDPAMCASVKPTPVESSPATTTTTVDSDPTVEPPASPSVLPEPQSSSIRSEVVMPSSPMVIHHVQSAPVHMQQSQQSAALLVQPSPPTTPTHSQGRESPSSAKGSTCTTSASNSNHSSQVGSPAQQKKTPAAILELATQAPVNNGSSGTGNLLMEEIHTKSSKSKNRAMSIEAAEKEWEERRQNMGHYNGREFERILNEAQANMMKGIPSLDVPSEGEASTAPPAALEETTPEWTQPEPSTEKPAKAKPAGPEKLPKSVLEKPTTTKPTAAADKVGKVSLEKSPPPPPPRKTFPTSSSGMTTTRSGEVVYTSRKESASGQEEDEAEVLAQAPASQSKPTKVPPETKPSTPPPVAASAIHEEEEEDEGDKIMAELQVFQKCTVKDVGVKSSVLETHSTRVEPQIRELRPGALLPHKEKKSSEKTREDKHPNADENGNTTPLRQSPGVIYYVTGQISKEQLPPPAAVEEAPERRDNPTLSPSQVSNVNANDNSPSQQPQPKPQQLGPPVSPKPLFLNGPSPLFQKQVVTSESLKTSPGVVKGVLESTVTITVDKPQISTVKRLETSVSSVVQESSISLSKSVVLPAALPEVPPPTTIREAPKAVVSPPEKVLSEATDQPRPWYEEVDEEASLSPDLPGEEAPPPPDNIAFMITNSKVQALSCGEYQELVNAKQGIQTVTVGGGPGKREMTNTTPGGRGGLAGSQDNGFNNKKPVIIIFDEPMDIRSAYKRLSTVFECEEELESMLAAERIEEEDEETEETERSSGGLQVKVKAPSGALSSSSSSLSRSSSSSSELAELSGDGKPDGKKKFKLRFPKKQLAALSQAIRTGTKTGKKTLQVVVYEDEEESDGTVRKHKEAKRFEIQSRSKPSAAPADKTPKAPAAAVVRREHSDSKGRTDKIRKSTYKTLDSLEQTIKQLETTISEMGPARPHQEKPVRSAGSVEPQAGCVLSGENGGLKRSLSLPSKSSLLKVPKPSKTSSQRKKTKPQLLPRPAVIPTATVTPVTSQQNATSVASPTSRMPVPLSAKSRQSPGTTTDKAGKQQKLQDSTQRQFRQANGSAKRAGGDHKTTSPTVPASKIPAFYPSSGKGSTSQSAPNSDATNLINLSSSSNCSSSSPHTTKSSIPSPHAPRHPGSALSTSSHIPSLSNGSSLKLPTPSHTGKALSFSLQTQNGRAPSSSFSSSSSPSPLSPTPLGLGMKSIRTIHTPSFTSYRPQNGSSGKSCIPTATAAKDST